MIHNLKIKPQHYLAGVVLLLFSCRQQEPLAVAQIKTAEEPKNTFLYISSFSDFPSEIEGCSCYFSNDSIDFKDSRYIYVNSTQISFLKVKGTLTKFTEVSHTDIDSLNSMAKYKSDAYEMTIEVKDKGKSGGETSLKAGTIKLTDTKSGQTLEKTFYGECGC